MVEKKQKKLPNFSLEFKVHLMNIHAPYRELLCI